MKSVSLAQDFRVSSKFIPKGRKISLESLTTFPFEILSTLSHFLKSFILCMHEEHKSTFASIYCKWVSVHLNVSDIKVLHNTWNYFIAMKQRTKNLFWFFLLQL